MKVKEVYVTRENPAEIFSLIQRVLSRNRNTQVFVDYRIYEELKKNGSDYDVYTKNYMKCFHYDQEEEWLALTDGSAFGEVIAKGSFVSNTDEYMQLVEFHSLKVDHYVHYLVGFKQLLLIRFKPK